MICASSSDAAPERASLAAPACLDVARRTIMPRADLCLLDARRGDVPSQVQTIQDDWENRELVEIVQLNVLTITKFLNKFDTSARYKLARINEKLSKLERALDYVEAAVKSTMEGE